jgi:hypothetical protein
LHILHRQLGLPRWGYAITTAHNNGFGTPSGIREHILTKTHSQLRSSTLFARDADFMGAENFHGHYLWAFGSRACMITSV